MPNETQVVETKNQVVVQDHQPITQPQNIDLSPEGLIAKAIERGLDVGSLERLMAMRKELRAEKAKEAFDEAMANFQGECPVIKKKKNGGTTDSGVVAYKYAPLEDIVDQVKPFIQKHGFSYAIKTEVTNGRVKSTCIVKHKLGHSEDSTMDVPMGTKTRVMSEPQVVAATSTFSKRYAFINAFGIMTGDDDTDARRMSQQQTAPRTIPPTKQAPTPMAPKGKTIPFECYECAEVITEAEAKYSKSLFKKPLCRKHQKEAKNK